jgi:hypothetical protein
MGYEPLRLQDPIHAVMVRMVQVPTRRSSTTVTLAPGKVCLLRHPPRRSGARASLKYLMGTFGVLDAHEFVFARLMGCM